MFSWLKSKPSKSETPSPKRENPIRSKTAVNNECILLQDGIRLALDNADERTIQILKSVINRIVLENEPKEIINQIQVIQQVLSDKYPGMVEHVLCLPYACDNWTGNIVRLKVLKKNTKRH